MSYFIKASIFLLTLFFVLYIGIKADKSPANTLDLSRYTLVSLDTQADSKNTNELNGDIIYFDISNSEISAHASSIVNVSSISDKSLMLLYFAGSREGARDVGIYQSFFTMANGADSINKNGTWSESRRILDANLLSKLSGKFIKKLGNPVSFVDVKGRVHLFVVGVSMGGWSTSKIYHLMFSTENLTTLHYLRELHLSPFLNISFLVRTPAMLSEDGGFILPVYHELARKYPLLLIFGSNLSLDSVYLPTNKHSLLQPSFVPSGLHSSVGVYRNHKAYNDILYVSECNPLCLEAKPSNLYNYDSSSVLFNALDSIFLLHNQTSRKEGNKREELWIYRILSESLMGDNVSFTPIMKLDSLLDSEVSYPSVTTMGDFVCVAYTRGRTHIRVAFVPISKFNQHINDML